MTKRQLYLLLLSLGSCKGREGFRSLKRRLGAPARRGVELLSAEETEFAILTRHSDRPEERNVFARPTSGSPDTPMPTPTGTTPSPTGPSTSPPPSPEPSATPPPSSEPPATGPDVTIEPTPTPGDRDLPTSTPGDVSTSTPSGVPTPFPGDGTDSPTTAPSSEPSSSGSATVAPSLSSSPSDAPSASAAPSAVGDVSVEDFLFQSLTDDGSLSTPGTPQNRALNTLISTNPELDPNDPADQVEITQRYVLNTLHFATNGEAWANNQLWASASPFCGEDVESSWHGVVCDEGGQQLIERISLAGNDLLGQLPSELRGLSTLSKLVVAIFCGVVYLLYHSFLTL
jgi:hypothetical protein